MNRVLSLLSLSVLFLLPVFAQAVPSQAPDLLPPATSQQAGQQYQDIRDIAGPVAIDPDVPYLVYGLAALCIAVAAALLMLFILKRRKAPSPPPVDPADTALGRLGLAESRLAETGTVSFATEVSNILRRYIEQTFRIPSTTQTTSEFFTSVSTGGFRDLQADISAHSNSLEKCLSLCDLAKYAAFQPARDAADHLLQEARAFINGTRPAKEAE